ncbi:MAG: disulfide bond formation protein B [Hyphomicrobiales bacterium]|nr:disulfide bond formation protein B [Hyphomicrobiales bacterium]
MKPVSVPTQSSPPFIAALAIAALGAGAIAGAYVFEYGLKLLPCPLCLEQRIPYYISIPLALGVAAAAWARAPRALVGGALIVIALVMLWGAGLGVYHSGVEWKWWAGPTDCTAPMTSLGSGGSLLQQLQQTSVVRCDEAAWRFLGLSLAGYNVLISAALALIALWGAFAKGSDVRV